METEALNSNNQQYGGNVPHSNGITNDRRLGYQGYQYQRRTIMSSPNSEYIQSASSPRLSPQNYNFKNQKMNGSPGTPIDFSNYAGTPQIKQDNEFIPKNPIYPSYSPRQTEVSFPDGDSYIIHDDQSVFHAVNLNQNQKEIPRQQSFTNQPISYSPRRITPQQNDPRMLYRQQGSQSGNSQYSNSRYYEDTRSRNDSRDDYNNSQKNRDSHKSKHHKYNESDSEISSSDSEVCETESRSAKRRRKRKDEKRESKENKQMLRLLMTDMLERKEREERERTESEKKIPNKSFSATPGFEIPKSEPIQPKSKIPSYEDMEEIDKEKFREKFRNNYNMLIVKYPRWKIELPDFLTLPLKIIHERYEQVVKTICIYQTAMKWKVYLIIMIAGIEYYVGHRNNFAFAKGLLKAQIKNIHKFDIYLVEFAEQFFSNEQGEDYPLWIRFLGTFASGLASFGSINGLSKMVGYKADIPDYIFEQADKFVSPPEGTAKLHSDAISDVPEPPEPGSFQDPNTLINGIGTLFSMFIGKNDQAKSTTAPQTAQPIPEKPKPVDDFDNVEF
jgi:hypothetical protein